MESDLYFCRMGVDVHLIERQFQEQDNDGIRGGGHASPVSFPQGSSYHFVAYHPAVHKKILRVSIGPLLMRPGAESMNPNLPRRSRQFDHIVEKEVSENLVYPFPDGCNSHGIEKNPITALQGKPDFRIRERIMGYMPRDVPCLGIVGFQEFSPGRHIKEEVAYGYFRTPVPGYGFNGTQGPSLDLQLCPRCDVGIVRPGLQCQA